ncbi:MAG: porin [Pedobacter sp.]|nr:porin [Pedobacter sp.]
MDLRLTPTLVFSDRQLQYVYANNQNDSVNNNITQKIQSTMVDFPLSLKIKSNRRKNYRAYLVGGLKYSMDITSDKKTSNEGKSAIDMVIQNRKNFVSYEAGLGLDLYFEYFKMSPELKYSASFQDILKPEANNPFSQSLDRLMLRHVTFSLFFE